MVWDFDKPKKPTHEIDEEHEPFEKGGQYDPTNGNRDDDRPLIDHNDGNYIRNSWDPPDDDKSNGN